jgi:ketosteroid isomerase-like protein
MSVTMYVGEEDRVWLQECKKVRNELEQLGAGVTLHVLEGQGHVLKIEPSTLFGDLENNRKPEASSAPTPSAFAGAESGPSRDDAVRDVGLVLDDFHDAASKADGPRYFGHFADDAVFLGTDATERWTLPEFKAFAKPYFEKGTGWTYTSRQRHINLTPDGRVAWFDELLDNAKLGECRGSGVLIRVGDGWKVAQYNLSIPIPNALAEQFAQTIAEKAGRNLRK